LWLRDHAGYDIDPVMLDIAATAKQVKLAKEMRHIARKVQREVLELVGWTIGSGGFGNGGTSLSEHELRARFRANLVNITPSVEARLLLQPRLFQRCGMFLME
jgi:hypothetical protein